MCGHSHPESNECIFMFNALVKINAECEQTKKEEDTHMPASVGIKSPASRHEQITLKHFTTQEESAKQERDIWKCEAMATNLVSGTKCPRFQPLLPLTPDCLICHGWSCALPHSWEGTNQGQIPLNAYHSALAGALQYLCCFSHYLIIVSYSFALAKLLIFHCFQV